jgi:glycerol-3-phosphate acyltransferase PlsY
LKTGKDIRDVQSGRTGGTNAMRAAGFWVGLSTALVDILKGTVAVWLARMFVPGNEWLAVVCPLTAIIGHNYSVFLLSRSPDGRLRLGGGAGGATSLGGSIGLWWPSVLVIFPLAALIYYFIGYASIATMSVAFLSALLFGYRAYAGLGPPEYIWYGVLSLALLLWALRPNIKRLFEGSERLHGYRARKQKQAAGETP